MDDVQTVAWRITWHDDSPYHRRVLVSFDQCHADDGTNDALVLRSDYASLAKRVRELEARLASSVGTVAFIREKMRQDWHCANARHAKYLTVKETVGAMQATEEMGLLEKYIAALDAGGGYDAGGANGRG